MSEFIGDPRTAAVRGESMEREKWRMCEEGEQHLQGTVMKEWADSGSFLCFSVTECIA